MTLHPEPVAENRSTRERRGGIDGYDAGAPAPALPVGDQHIRQAALARARRPGQTDRARCRGRVVKLVHQDRGFRAAVLYDGQRTGQSPQVPAPYQACEMHGIDRGQEHLRPESGPGPGRRPCLELLLDEFHHFGGGGARGEDRPESGGLQTGNVLVGDHSAAEQDDVGSPRAESCLATSGKRWLWAPERRESPTKSTSS